MAKFTKTNNKVSFFKIAQSKYNELLNATEGSEIGIIAGAIYFVEDGNVGRIYVDKKCYGEANLSNSVTNVTLESEGENAGKIKVTYSTGDPTYIPLPEGKVYTAGKGIAISASDEISALDEEIGSEIKVTQAVGALDTNKTFDATTKLKDILKQMLQKEMQPTVTQPSVSLTFTSAKAYEVGTKITPSYSAKLNAGSYSYGPATGITATSWSVSATGVENPITTATGSFPEITVTEDMNYKVTAVATHEAGADPVTNLGNPADASKKIAAGTKSATSGSITSFRSFFYGTKTTGLDSYDSAAVRLLTNGNAKAEPNKKFNITIPAGTKQVVIAVPAARSLKSVINVGLSRGEVADTFVASTVDVEGANGYAAAPYKVYVFNSSTALDDNTYEVTLA